MYIDPVALAKILLTIVPIKAVAVSPMMYPVVRGSIQYPLKWPQGTHYFCVNPELVQEVQLLVDYIRSWRNGHSIWKIKELYPQKS